MGAPLHIATDHVAADPRITACNQAKRTTIKHGILCICFIFSIK